jgi:MOSC domain-containing protein YiiM
MHPCQAHSANPRVVAVSISAGGIPKHPLLAGLLAKVGFVGDGHSHAKHIREDRAVSLLDQEILQRLVQEGFPLVPGAVGENLTVAGLGVQQMPPGTLLQIGSAILQLEQPRKPCYVLDAIDPLLKDAIVGRCGYMASVIREGWIRPGMRIEVLTNETTGEWFGFHDDDIEGAVARLALAQLLGV